MDPLILAKREACRRHFRNFLPYWKFRNRESGETLAFDLLWPGQDQFVDVMEAHQWVFALKAGKLGFTELECAFDAWRAIFGHQNSRIHLFSKDAGASRELLRYIKFGVRHLPEWMRVRFAIGEAGASTSQSMMFKTDWMGEDDWRTIISYPATTSVAIDLSATHTHVDELSHMMYGQAVWNSVATTVAPNGTCHVVTRGAGDATYSAELWYAAKAAPPEAQGRDGIPFPFFAPYLSRPDRSPEARAKLADSGAMTLGGLSYFLPETEEDALAGSEESPYIPVERWDSLYEPNLPPLLPGSREPVILSVDAGVTGDCFGIVAITRHPDPTRYRSDVAIRRVKKWTPDMFPTHRIDFATCEEFIRFICHGGCPAGHPPPSKELAASGQSYHAECDHCAKGDWTIIPGHNVVQVTYDMYQLEDMAQRLRKDGVAWMSEFDQGSERLIGDGMLYKLAFAGRLAHNNDPDLREHIGNAKAKLQPDEESKMRMIKKAPNRKIDLAVAAAMGAKRCLDLNL